MKNEAVYCAESIAKNLVSCFINSYPSLFWRLLFVLFFLCIFRVQKDFSSLIFKKKKSTGSFRTVFFYFKEVVLAVH